MAKKRKKWAPVGVGTVKDFKKGEFLKLIDKNGKSGKKVYIRGDYDRSTKKYILIDTNDVWGNGRLVSGSRKAHDNFTY